MVQAAFPWFDIIQLRSNLASHWVKSIELESLISIWASVFALKITNTQLVV